MPRSLAIIVVARNEERTIEACLRSCIDSAAMAEEMGLAGSPEIVLVDSASRDRTRQIASTLPVRIIELPSEWPLSAAAGRFVGLGATSSDTVFFVDGDYVLEPSWLRSGLEAFTDPSVAAVCGVDREALKGESAISRYVAKLTERLVPDSDFVEVEAAPIGLYRRAWIERAGGIQPFLKGAEDRDLGIRIRAKGGRIRKTRALMGTHHWNPGDDLNLMEYLRSVAHWSYGEGQGLRVSWDDRAVRRTYVRRYLNGRHAMQAALGLYALAWGSSVAATALLGNILSALSILLAGYVAIVITARRNREAWRESLFRFHQVPYVVVRLLAFALGFLRPPRPASEYPWDPRIARVREPTMTVHPIRDSPRRPKDSP